MSSNRLCLLFLSGALLLGCAAAEAHHRTRFVPDGASALRSHSLDHARWCGLHFAERKYRQAIADCDEALVDDPADGESYSNRGAAYLMIDEVDQAISDFETAIRMNGSFAIWHYNLATAYIKKGQHAKALFSYNEVLRLDPGLAPAYNNRAHVFEVLGDREKAIADYRRALELAPALSSVIRQNLQRLGAE